MAGGRPLAPLTLTEEERETLQRWVQRRTTAQALAQRARLILAAAEGASNDALVARLHLTPQTVKWRRRFVAARLDGVLDEPRPGAPRAIGDAEVERVITLTLERRPEAATHWSTRSMAAHAGLSQSAISRIWRAFGLQPHRTDTFKLSHDPLFIEKMRDIVGLYSSRRPHWPLRRLRRRGGYPAGPTALPAAARSPKKPRRQMSFGQ